MRFPEVPFLLYILNNAHAHKLVCLLQYGILPPNAYIFQLVGMPSNES